MKKNGRIKEEIGDIKKNIKKIEKTLLDSTPKHFSPKDIVNAFFGALIIGLTFTLKGAVVATAINLNAVHITAIFSSTILILLAETYFISWTKVRNKKERGLGQFLFKRVTAMFVVAFVVSIYLVYVFGINNQQLIANNPVNVIKMVILVSMPCAVGAAIPGLLTKKIE